MKHIESDAPLIVTGSTPEAEAFDRPAAYALRDRMEGATVCSDLWFLNRPELRTRPVISIGGPGNNALTAYLADKLPGVLVVDGKMAVQMGDDPVRACCWGATPELTAKAVALFETQFAEEFLSRV